MSIYGGTKGITREIKVKVVGIIESQAVAVKRLTISFQFDSSRVICCKTTNPPEGEGERHKGNVRFY